MSNSSKKASRTGPKTGKPSKETGAKSTNSFFRKNKLQIILFCLVFLVFGNGIFNGYALDDEFYTNGSNPLTQKGIKGIPEIFKSRTFFNNDGSGYSYRPVAAASFALEIQLFGERPRTSHLINVLLYAFTVVLLFNLLRKWFKSQGDWFSFIICLLFLVHPIHTEVVDNIKCRDELLAFFFTIVSFQMAWRHVVTGAKWALAAMSVAFVLAVLSKTSVAPFVILIPFSIWYFTDKKWWQAAAYVLPILIAVAFVRFALISQIPDMSRTLQGFENPIADMSKSQTFATAAYVLGRYLYLMVLPYPLIFYYGLNEVPIATWSNPLIILSVIVYIALAVWTWFEFRKKTPAGFGMIWFAGNIALFSNLFGAAPGLMAERFAYCASLGFIIAAVDMIFRWKKVEPSTFNWKSSATQQFKWIFLGIAIVYSLRSIVRNETWQDKETLYRNDQELAPESAKINMLLGSYLSAKGARLGYEASQHINIAKQYMMQGMQQQAALHQDSARMKRSESVDNFVEARTYYLNAVEVFPSYFTAWSNLGTSYYFTREYRGGIPYFHKAIEVKKDYPEAYFNLGMSYEQLALKEGVVTDTMLLDSAVYFFNAGLEQDPKYVGSAEQLGRIYFQYYGDSVSAMRVLRKAAEANPKSAAPWNAMANIYLQTKDTATAALMMEKAAELDPTNLDRLRNLSSYYARHGNNEKANYFSTILQQQEAEFRQRQRLLGKDK